MAERAPFEGELRDEKEEKARLEQNALRTNNHILTQDFSDEYGNKYWAKFKTEHFDSGVSRFAFKGTLRGSGPKKDQQCVVKVFKDEFAKDIDLWVPDLYTSIRAKELCKEFNDEHVPTLRLAEAPVKMEFVLPMLARVDETTMNNSATTLRKNKKIAKQEFVAIEQFIEGEYVKFNSNAGYEQQELSELMPAFTHWTWERTARKMMVCDLQGVKRKEGNVTHYILTDPAIHSVDETFGLTDCGATGMYKVLTAHRCNDICKQLQLEDTSVLRLMLLVELLKNTGTTYNFQLTENEKKMNELEKRE